MCFKTASPVITPDYTCPAVIRLAHSWFTLRLASCSQGYYITIRSPHLIPFLPLIPAGRDCLPNRCFLEPYSTPRTYLIVLWDIAD
jgi:hypothetical protein